jgi:hypothetical protein
MSYESSVIELNPILYCPIFVFSEQGPRDLISNVPSTITGGFSVEFSDVFPKRAVKLNALSSIDVEIAGQQQFFDLPISYCFWFNKQDDPGPVFSIGDPEEGFAISVNENNNLVVFYDGTSADTLTESVSDDYHFIVISIDQLFFYNGEDGEDGEGGGQDSMPFVTVYFDGNPVYTTEDFSFPADYDIFFNSFYGEPGDSETKISQYFVFPTALSEKDVRALYDIAVGRAQKEVIESDTNIFFLDQNQIALQTSWQAYGIVTGKQ